MLEREVERHFGWHWLSWILSNFKKLSHTISNVAFLHGLSSSSRKMEAVDISEPRKVNAQAIILRESITGRSRAF